MSKDMVNHPPHYNDGGVECIDYIQQQLGANYPSYLEGSIIKYTQAQIQGCQHTRFREGSVVSQ